MQESVGYSVTINIIITFIVIVFAFITAALIYFKSNKVGNIITESIEKHSGYNLLSQAEINSKLTSIGYNKRKVACPAIANCSSVINPGEVFYSGYDSRNDGYCVYICFESEVSKPELCSEYYYYKVRTNMFINVPIINNIVDMPIYSETNRMYNFSYDASRCG